MFEKESGTAPGLDVESASGRTEIRKAVQAGDVESAIDRVNDLNPEVREDGLLHGHGSCQALRKGALGPTQARAVCARSGMSRRAPAVQAGLRRGAGSQGRSGRGSHPAAAAAAVGRCRLALPAARKGSHTGLSRTLLSTAAATTTTTTTATTTAT